MIKTEHVEDGVKALFIYILFMEVRSCGVKAWVY